VSFILINLAFTDLRRAVRQTNRKSGIQNLQMTGIRLCCHGQLYHLVHYKNLSVVLL